MAFCVAPDTAGNASDARITEVFYDGEDEPKAVAWESDVPIETVVVKYGGQEGGVLYNYDGGTSGTTTWGDGTESESGQNEPNPCPADENRLVKYDYGGGSFVVDEQGSEDGGQGNGNGAQGNNGNNGAQGNDGNQGNGDGAQGNNGNGNPGQGNGNGNPGQGSQNSQAGAGPALMVATLGLVAGLALRRSR